MSILILNRPVRTGWKLQVWIVSHLYLIFSSLTTSHKKPYIEMSHGELSVRQKRMRWKVLTVKCSYGEISLRETVLTVKCPYGETFHTENSNDKMSYGLMSRPLPHSIKMGFNFLIEIFFQEHIYLLQSLCWFFLV